MKEKLHRLYFETVNVFIDEMKKEKDDAIAVETYLDILDCYHREFGREMVDMGAISQTEHDAVTGRIDKITDWLWGKNAHQVT